LKRRRGEEEERRRGEEVKSVEKSEESEIS